MEIIKGNNYNNIIKKDKFDIKFSLKNYQYFGQPN